ncbi:MAG: metallopeptidase family protein [Parcubacteria group bacterium]|nr:metallopeptidase family protein [Parcubacteria group bacterium]
MTKEEFENLITAALTFFPQHFREQMKNVAIIIQDEPDDFQKQQLGYSSGDYLLGLYEGVPQIKRQNYNKAVPDKITFFQNNIERISGGNQESIKQIIIETLWHEIGHHFGMDEAQVRNFINRKFKN